MPIRRLNYVRAGFADNPDDIPSFNIFDASGNPATPTGLESWARQYRAQEGDVSDSDLILALQRAGRAPAGDVESTIDYLNRTGWKPEPPQNDDGFFNVFVKPLATFAAVAFGFNAGASATGLSIVEGGEAIAAASGAANVSPVAQFSDVPFGGFDNAAVAAADYSTVTAASGAATASNVASALGNGIKTASSVLGLKAALDAKGGAADVAEKSQFTSTRPGAEMSLPINWGPFSRATGDASQWDSIAWLAGAALAIVAIVLLFRKG